MKDASFFSRIGSLRRKSNRKNDSSCSARGERSAGARTLSAIISSARRDRFFGHFNWFFRADCQEGSIRRVLIRRVKDHPAQKAVYNKLTEVPVLVVVAVVHSVLLQGVLRMVSSRRG